MLFTNCRRNGRRVREKNGLFRLESLVPLIIHLPQSKTGHFHFAKYLNSLVSRRFDKESTGSSEEGNMNAEAICRDKSSQKFILLAIEHYSAALKLDLRHVYQALPRLLSLWFDFVSIYPEKGREDGTSPALKRDQLSKYAFSPSRLRRLPAHGKILFLTCPPLVL